MWVVSVGRRAPPSDAHHVLSIAPPPKPQAPGDGSFQAGERHLSDDKQVLFLKAARAVQPRDVAMYVRGKP
jgi:hypothetical protein